MLLVQAVYQLMLGHIVSGALQKFKYAFDRALNGGQGFVVAARDCTAMFMKYFDEECADAVIKQANWDTSRVRDKLHRDIVAHVTSVCTTKISELATPYESKLKEAISGPMEALLDGASDDTWPAIRKLLRRETETAVIGCSAALNCFEIDEDTKKIVLSRLENFARGVVESKAKEESRRVLIRMKYRFTDSMLRVWTGKEDLRTITKTGRSSSLKFLSMLAAIRLDDDADNIWDTLALALLDSNSVTSRSIASVDPLASSTWEQVPATKTLLTPVQCKNLWRQFQSETEYIVTQASAAKVMVAMVRCEEIADEKYSAFIADEEWHGLRDVVQSHRVPGFGKKLSLILDTYLSKYDIDTTYFEDNVRTAKRKLLEEKLLQLVQPAYHSMLGHIQSEALDKFRDAFGRALNGEQGFEVTSRDCTAMFMKYFDEECADVVVKQAKWDTARVRDKLHGDISAHVASVCTAKLAEVTALYESQLREAISGPVEALVDGASDDTSPATSNVLRRPETLRLLRAAFSAALSRFGVDEDTKKTWLSRFDDFGDDLLLLLFHMKRWIKRFWTTHRQRISEVVVGFLHRVKAWFSMSSTSVQQNMYEMAVAILFRSHSRILSLPPVPMHR